MDTPIITINDLRHGDVLLYSWRKHQSIFVRGIRLITGSQFVHASVVQEIDGRLYVLEQQQERMHSLISLYYAFDGEDIYAFRPTFTPPPPDKSLFERRSYGYVCIMDCLLNHFLSFVTAGKWVYKPLIKNLTRSKNIDCSITVAYAHRLSDNASWCLFNDVIEPDDYANHPESYKLVGLLSW